MQLDVDESPPALSYHNETITIRINKPSDSVAQPNRGSQKKISHRENLDHADQMIIGWPLRGCIIV